MLLPCRTQSIEWDSTLTRHYHGLWNQIVQLSLDTAGFAALNSSLLVSDWIGFDVWNLRFTAAVLQFSQLSTEVTRCLTRALVRFLFSINIVPRSLMASEGEVRVRVRVRVRVSLLRSPQKIWVRDYVSVSLRLKENPCRPRYTSRTKLNTVTWLKCTKASHWKITSCM